MKTTVCQLHSHEAFANVMGLVISVVCYLQADIPVIRHLSVNWKGEHNNKHSRWQLGMNNRSR